MKWKNILCTGLFVIILAAGAVPAYSENITVVEPETAVDPSDAFADCTDAIAQELSQIADMPVSLQREMELVEEVYERYVDAAYDTALCQAELNNLAYRSYTLWDTELNILWSRIKLADTEKYEPLLEEQKHWIELKESVVREGIADFETGSMYPMLYCGQSAHLTRTRCYYLAELMAREKGETFAYPEVQPWIYINNHDSDEAMDILKILDPVDSRSKEASFKIHSRPEIHGTVTAAGTGYLLLFLSEDGKVKATVICGWNSAALIITESDEQGYAAGEMDVFTMAF